MMRKWSIVIAIAVAVVAAPVLLAFVRYSIADQSEFALRLQQVGGQRVVDYSMPQAIARIDQAGMHSASTDALPSSKYPSPSSASRLTSIQVKQGIVEKDGKMFRYKSTPQTIMVAKLEQMNDEDVKRYKSFVELVGKLRQVDLSEELRNSARAQLRTLIASEIEDDITRKDEQLSELEANAKSTREQVEKRKELKEELILMNLMLIENPATGLGLPAEWLQTLNTTVSHVGIVPASTASSPTIWK